MQKEKGHPFRYTIQYLNSLIWILAFILFISSIAMAQWDKQSPVPTHLDIRGTGTPTAQRVFIATDDNFFDNGGALFESNDGGATWLQRDVPLSLGESFNGLFFLDSQNGWAFGNDNYKTTDGGTTWNQLQFLGSTYFMKFYTTTFGLAAGNFGQMVSTDGGASWEPSPHEMFSFDFADALIGIGVSDSGLYRTTDGGVTFVSVHTDSSKAVAFLSTNVAAAIAGNLYIRSTDGGTTWTPGSVVSDRNRLFPISGDIVLSWNKLAAFPSGDGNVSRSTDGGQTWTDLGVVIPEGIHSLTLSDAQTVIASDVKGNMFRSSNAGLTWVQTFTSPGPMPGFLGSTEPAFANAQTGYYGYGSGFVIKTTDGGNTWIQISSGTHQTLNDIDRFANGNLIAVGDNGIILTSNGAAPWLHQEILTAENLSAVQVLSANEAVVLDAEGQVYISTDGGITWTASGIKSPIGNAKDLHFNNLLDGWVTGADFDTSSLFHTTNGGNSWTPVEDIIGTYVAMDFEGINGWTLNTGGLFYSTTDNGVTWTPKELPGFPSVVSDIDFFNADTGYAVGWEGYAARSIDGGNTWEILQVPEGADKFTSIYVISANEFWVSTNDDAAYYSANGGLNWAVLEIGSSGFGSFSAIAASPEGDAWAAGYQGFIEHFTGPPPPPLNQPPHASFNYLASGLTLQFTDTSIDPDGSIIGWEWDFGDSTFSTEQNPLHTFPEADTYIIRLTVTDNDSSTGSGIRIIAVQPGPGGVFGNFTEVTPLDSVFVTPDDEDFWVITTAPADYDSDGDLDIAVLGYYVIYNVSVEERLLLLRNNGPAGLTQWDFTYINVPLDGLSTGASDLAWGDADGDGDLDLAVGTDLNTVIYRNDDSTLIMSDTELPGYLEDNDQADFDLRSITWADFDNDGDLDLLLPSVYEDSTFSYKTSLMRNDGPNGTGGFIFIEMDSVFAPTIHAQSAWADYDGDQDLDLLLINMAPLTEDGFIRRYRNDGNGVFTGENILDSLTIEHGEAQWGDYDGDGDLDILVAGHIKELNGSFTQTLRIYQNSSEVYVPVEVIDCIPCEEWVDLTAATWAD